MLENRSMQEAAAALKDILVLSREPIAVKFFEDVALPDDFELPSGRRYCQALMDAREGQKILLTAENISCPAAAWALGFRPPPVKLSSGQMPAEMGIFENPAAARNTLAMMRRLEMGKYRMVACCPLGQAAFEPDVVVIESFPEELMWIALALLYETGGRLEFSTAVLQAICVDVTIIPFVDQKLNVSLGCYGCREATDLAGTECAVGFPLRDLQRIAGSLMRLNERAIPRVRNKVIYQALRRRTRKPPGNVGLERCVLVDQEIGPS